jgi:hypothetical protein
MKDAGNQRLAVFLQFVIQGHGGIPRQVRNKVAGRATRTPPFYRGRREYLERSRSASRETPGKGMRLIARVSS